MSTPEPPPGPPPGDLPTAPSPAAVPRVPRVPLGPGTPAAGTPGAPYPPGGAWVVRDPRLWWQREAAIVAIGLLMLGVGGVVGYLIGHGNAKTRVVAATRPGVSTVVTHTATVTTPGHTVTTPGHTVTTPGHTSPVAHVRTVTTPGKTVTTPGKTVFVKQPPRVVHSTTTNTVTRTTTVTTTASSGSSTAGGSPQAFNGSGNGSLGTITVPIASQLKWQCPGCANATFTVSNSSTDPSQLGVQAQNTTSGQTPVAAGKYTNVNVQATGSWSITITAGSG
jgi:hypothetical protein